MENVHAFTSLHVLSGPPRSVKHCRPAHIVLRGGERCAHRERFSMFFGESMNKKCDPLSSAATGRRLVAAGCPMPGEIQQERQRDLIIEVSRPQATIAYDMHAGAEYVFGVRITNRSYSCLVLQEFRCRLPWPAQVLLLGDPRSHSPECENYRLESGRKFQCEDVAQSSRSRERKARTG